MSFTENPVQWFEIPVRNIVASTKFYEELFSTKLQPQEMGPAKMAMFSFDGSKTGASGALVQSEGYQPSNTGSVVYFTVSNLDETLKRVPELGGKVVVPRTSIGEHGFIAHFEDKEGNRVALHTI